MLCLRVWLLMLHRRMLLRHLVLLYRMLLCSMLHYRMWLIGLSPWM
jgi:hypothetical protein